MLENYRGRFPFKLSTTSYIYPDEIVPNVVRLGPFFDEIELVLFESESPDSIPDTVQIDHLIELSKLHRLGFNIHLPLDISLGDECDDVRTHGISITKTVMERTLALHPSLYTLHLDFIDRLAPLLPRNGVAMSSQGSKTTKAILQGIRDKEIATPACRNSYSPDALEGALRRAGTLSSFARNDKKGPPKKGEGGVVQERDVEAWRQRVSRSLNEILNNGVEAKRISIETLAYPFEWIEDMVSQGGFSICLDIGHILTHGYDLGHYLESYLSRTSIVHLHGVHKGSDHLGIEKLPEPDLNLILSALRHYHGVVSIEVFSINALESSLSILEEKWIKG